MQIQFSHFDLHNKKRPKLFVPVNNNCIDCNVYVEIDVRQELCFDQDGNCRRRCGTCIEKITHQLIAINSKAMVAGKGAA